jgi:protein-S-isoprenylcysteine O-methyltransferase Ste14
VVEDHLILGIAWILFGLFHSVFASIGFKAWLSKKIKSSFIYFRLYYTLFALVSFIAILWYQLNIKSPYVFQRTTLTLAAGMFVGFAGLVIMMICIRKYFGQLSGLKTLFIDEVQTGNQLIITGIHKHVRHPLYLGTFTFIWGLFIFFPEASLLISNFVITVYTLIGIRFEEEKLVREFGQSYIEYKKSVPKIIPSFKPSSAN